MLPPEALFLKKSLKYSLNTNIPFFIGTYKVVYRRGAKKAEKYLVSYLNEALNLLKNDSIILNRDALFDQLETAISNITNIDFQDERFFKTHKFGYIKLLKRMSRPDKPFGYQDFKAVFQKEKRKEGILFKEIDIRAAWDAVKEQYVLPPNPNLTRYKEIFEIVYPIRQYGLPVTKLFLCYKDQVELVLEQAKPKNIGRRLPNFSGIKSKIYPDKIEKFSYFLYPETFSLANEGKQEVKILSGARMGPRMGHGFISYYRVKDNKLSKIDDYTHWIS